MAVSLKNTTESTEEETINTHMVQQKRFDLYPIERIRLSHPELEEREIWDLWDKYWLRYKIKRIICIAALIVLVLAVLSVVIVFAV